MSLMVKERLFRVLMLIVPLLAILIPINCTADLLSEFPKIISADEQLIDTEKFATSKSFVEFRARSGFPGHAFIFFGMELDNGLTYVKGIAGFYPTPDGSKRQALKNVANGPGIVGASLKDFRADVSFKVYPSAEEMDKIFVEVKKFNGYNYDLLAKNCVDLVTAVSKTVGIRTKGLSAFPFSAMRELRKRNQIRLLLEGKINQGEERLRQLEIDIETANQAYINARSEEIHLLEKLAVEQRRLEQVSKNDLEALKQIEQNVRNAQQALENAVNLMHEASARRDQIVEIQHSATVSHEQFSSDVETWKSENEIPKTIINILR